MDRSLLPAVAPCLEAGENVLWIGRPAAGELALSRMPVALCGLTIVLLFTLSPLHDLVVSTTTSTLRPLNDIRSLESPLGMVSRAIIMLNTLLMLTPFLSFWYASRTIYAVTERRLLQVRDLPVLGRQVREIRLASIGRSWFDEKPSRTGRLHLVAARDDEGVARSVAPLLGLAAVPGVRDVHRIVAEQISAVQVRSAEGKDVEDYVELLMRGERRLDAEQDK